MSESTLANRPKNEIRVLLEGPQFQQQVARVLPTHLNAERFIRIAITATTRTPKLLECTPQSFFKCLLDLSALGLEPDGRRAHLIPFNKECTLIIDWKGLAELAMRSGIVSKLHADVVCENDKFAYDRGELKQHEVNYREPRGKVYAVYAICTFKDGNEKCDVMSLDEVNAIRKRSRSGSNGPWVTDFNEMAKKTVFRRLSKWLPLSAEFRDALEKDGDVVEDAPRTERPAIGRIVPGEDEPFTLPGGGEDEDNIPMGDSAPQESHSPADPSENIRRSILQAAANLGADEKKLVRVLTTMRLMEPTEKFDKLSAEKLGEIENRWAGDNSVEEALKEAK